MFHISLPLASIYLAQLATAKRTLQTEEKLGNISNRNTGIDLNDHYLLHQHEHDYHQDYDQADIITGVLGGLPGLLISELGIIRRRVISHDLCYNP